MNDFRDSIGQFREAMHQEGERSVRPSLQSILRRERGRANLRLRWALAAAMLLVLGVVPVWRSTQQREREAAQDRADELLMEQVNAGLSRGVPMAMQPLLNAAFENKETNR